MKNWKGDEPWKNREPGARLSERAHRDQMAGESQRRQMEDAATQEVLIVLPKSLFSPGQYKSFRVEMKLPLNKDEIDQRMRAAFPDLTWREF